MLKISIDKSVVTGVVNPGGSKSISNRALIMRALAGVPMPIYNVSQSTDTIVLAKLLKENPEEWNVGDAGTAARFSAAFLATRIGQERVLTGSERMKQRPMKPLFDALVQLGAEIKYLEKEGFLPVRITGAKLSGGTIHLPHDISSQFISALAMIAPYGKSDLVMEFEAPVSSASYLDMTLALLSEFYIYFAQEFDEDGKNRLVIHVGTPILPDEFWVEPDWSSASFWYAAIALADEGNLELMGYTEESIQGDSMISSLFEALGVSTRFTEDGINIRRTEEPADTFFEFDFSDHPDLVPVFALTLPLLGIQGRLLGLNSLRYKESDRVNAVLHNLSVLGIQASAAENDTVLEVYPCDSINKDALIRCFGDHRMAMTFAFAVLKAGSLSLDEPETVLKSYPEFWKDVEKILKTSKIN